MARAAIKTRAGPKEKADDLQTLNFKVSAEFKKAYKLYAVGREMSMLDLLREGFELSKKRHKL